MAVNKRLLQGAAAAGGLVPSEHFGVVLYEGDGSSSHSINGGKFGAGAYFNGEQNSGASYINIDNSTTSPVSSISLWVNSKTKDSNFGTFIDAGGGSSINTGFAIARAATTGYIRVTFTNGSVGNTQIFNGTTDVCDGSWHHIVLSLADDNTFVLYLDGSSHITGTRTRFTTSDSHNLSINRFGTNAASIGASTYEGKLDQVRIFQKALSSSEVSTLYAETTPESLDPLSEDTTDTLQVLGDSSCIATYRFENNEVDLSGNYDATGYEIQYAVGRYGQALDLNGTSSYAQVGTSDIITGTAFSVSIWVIDEASSGYRNFLSQQADNNKGFYIGRHTNANTLRFNDLSISCTLGSSWNHLVFTVNGSTAKTYQNGSLIDTKTNWAYFSSEASRNGSGVRIGRQHGTGTAYWLGKLDQLRIFNKELSASEVTTLYNENSLVASYRFEGNANDDTRNYDGTASNVTYEYGLGFTPDFVWLKQRDAVRGHNWFDSTRGAENVLFSNSAGAASQEPAGTTLGSFDTGGFTVGTGNGVNADGGDYVAWCLKANGGTTSSNTDGNVTTTVQVNETAGFSIGTMSSTGITSSQSFGHGLGNVGDGVPDLLIVKGTSQVSEWRVYSSALNNYDGFLQLYTTAALYTASIDSTFNSSTFTLQWTGTAQNWVFYAFKEIEGFSKFGTYTGNGSTDGPIVETGFEPAFVILKSTTLTTAGSYWSMYDNKRNTTNPKDLVLRANDSAVEITPSANPNLSVNFLSNGFQIVGNYDGINGSGHSYFYIAFAADPDTEAPTVAKSFSTVTYTGTGSALSIEGLGFKPGLVWLKNRSYYSHYLYDTLRGPTQYILSDYTYPNTTYSGLTSFDSDGFTLGTGNENNLNNSSHVAWAWKADDNEPTITGGSALAVYKFEDNANDVRGNYNGTATNITYTTGKFNKAAVFVESNSSEINFNNSLHGSTFSMSFWLKATDMGAGTDATAYSLYSAWIDANNYFRPVLYGDGKLLLLSKYAGTFKSNTTATGLIIENTWHHIVFNFTPTDTKAYVDGVNVGTFPTYDSISFTSKALGTDRGTPDFTGQIDQLRFYDAALTQENVTALYNETAADNDDLTLGAPGETIISANANAGFSIVKYEGDGVSGKQIPHGLSAAPEMIMIKDITTNGTDWVVGHTSLGFSANKFVKLNLSNSEFTNAAAWASTNPTSTTFTLGSGGLVNASGDNYIAYCFHSVSGYSKIGSYSGTGTTNAITGLGFQPDWILVKRTDATDNWAIIDSVREAYLLANLTDAEGTYNWFAFTSDGFTLSTSTINASGGTYIYAAFKIN